MITLDLLVRLTVSSLGNRRPNGFRQAAMITMQFEQFHTTTAATTTTIFIARMAENQKGQLPIKAGSSYKIRLTQNLLICCFFCVCPH